jgi:hypothetical protein
MGHVRRPSTSLRAGFKVVPFHGAIDATGSSVMSLKFVEEQMQALRLRLPHKARQTSLRMTDHYDANF